MKRRWNPVRVAADLGRSRLPDCAVSPCCRGRASTTRRARSTRSTRCGSSGRARGLVLAAWRLLRCNPLSYGGYDPVERQRLFRAAGARGAVCADDRQGVGESCLWLSDFFFAILEFLHENLGISWSWAIVLLTVIIRIVLIPLTWRQIKSMRAMQALQPHIKLLQEKYKDDRAAPEPEAHGVLPGEQGEPVRVLSAAAAAVPGVLGALLHAAATKGRSTGTSTRARSRRCGTRSRCRGCG